MTSRRSISSQVVVTFGIAALLAMVAGSGCSGSSDANSNRGGSGGDSGEGATSNGGSSNGGTPNGGASGDSTGATSGSAGTDATGGLAGEAGGDSGGSSSGASGAAGSSGGGSGGSGPGGMGGGGAAGTTGTLGEPCSPRGALACAGNHQKLTVLCGGDDTWQPNQTCGSDEFCDSTPGPNVGTCQPVAPGCEDGPGRKWCDDDDKHLITCGPDAVTTPSVACPRACHGGVCRDDVGDCPVWEDYEVARACSSDCSEPMPNPCGTYPGTSCVAAGVTGFPAVVRTPWADESCPATCSRLAINIPGSHSYLRATATPPWSFATCQENRQGCSLIPPGDDDVLIVYALPDSVPSNIVLEEFEAEPTCP